jgi:putative spermidine/putrescine transport system ATP-binding protein
MTHLVIEGLTKRYGGQLAVDDLSLTVERGEFISLLGPSGCGKTTTLQMIAGFVEASSGRILLDGADLASVPPSKRGLGIVFQSYALFPHMNVAQNIAFGLEMRGIDRIERDRRTAEVMKLVGLDGFAERFPRRMSGGQQQRVALARALVIKPALLLLDEPLSNLDAKLREEMQGELRAIQRSVGTTTILVTHDQNEAMALSDRIVVMNKGRSEQIARPDEAYAHPASAFVANFLGKTNLLNASVAMEGGAPMAVVGNFRLPAPGAASGPIRLAVRPERVGLAANGANGLDGTVTSRVFQGLFWILQVDTAAGKVTVVRQNDGMQVPAEGENVTLAFAPADCVVLDAAAAP